MMKKLVIFFAAIFILLGCKKESSPTQTSPFVGNWTGTYTGTGDNGTFSIVVTGSGSVSGTVTSIVFSEDFNVTGSVSNSGVFQAVAGTVTSGATFSGTFSGNSGSGTWVNNVAVMNGNWTATKQ